MNPLRGIINLTDRLLFNLWLGRFCLGSKMWGADFQMRRLALTPARYLVKMLNHLGAIVAPDVTIKAGILFDNLERGFQGLQIASKAYLGPGVFLDLAAPIIIETEAVLAPQVKLITHGDVGARMLAKYIKRQEGQVTLKQGCWIGTAAIIMPNITIGEGAVVGAGAVVTQDVPPFTVVAGVPARVLRQLAK